MGDDDEKKGKISMEWERIGKRGKTETWKGSGAAEINSLWGSQDRSSGVQMLYYKHSVGYGRNTSHQFALDMQWKISSSLRSFSHVNGVAVDSLHVYGQQSLHLIRSAFRIFPITLDDKTFFHCARKQSLCCGFQQHWFLCCVHHMWYWRLGRARFMTSLVCDWRVKARVCE